MTDIGKFSPFQSLSPPLIVYQSVGVILGIRPPQHDLSCFASHARADRAAWQGATSCPVASPRSRGVSHPMHPGPGASSPRGPYAEALPLRHHQGAFVPLWNPAQRGMELCSQGASPLEPTEGPCPSAPPRGGWAKSRAAGVPPEPDQRGFRAPWTHAQEYPS